MSAYLGSLGRLVELKCPATQAVGSDEAFTFSRTLEGKVKAQTRPVSRRVWSLQVSTATPQEVGTLAGFTSGEWGRGPFIWVSPDAPVVNMLTPEQASCDPAIITAGSVSKTGPLALPEGGYAGRSLFNSDPAVNLVFGLQVTPVLPGQPVTASAFLVGAGSKVGISFQAADGSQISSTLSTASGVAGIATRLAVTVTAPANAVSARVYGSNSTQGARPAITWTDRVFEWGDGQGCPRAVVSSLSRDLVLALRDPLFGRYSDASFTITELG